MRICVPVCRTRSSWSTSFQLRSARSAGRLVATVGAVIVRVGVAVARTCAHPRADGSTSKPRAPCREHPKPVLGYSCAAGWSSSVARWAHNPEVAGSNPVPATENEEGVPSGGAFFVSCPDPRRRGSARRVPRGTPSLVAPSARRVDHPAQLAEEPRDHRELVIVVPCAIGAHPPQPLAEVAEEGLPRLVGQHDHACAAIAAGAGGARRVPTRRADRAASWSTRSRSAGAGRRRAGCTDCPAAPA